MRRSDDADRAIAPKFRDQRVDQPRFDERLVALNVDHELELLVLLRNFRDPIRSARVLWRRKRSLRSPRSSGLEYPFVVGRDDHRVDIGALRSLPNVTKERFASDGVQRLAGKSRRVPTRGNDDERFHCAVTSSGVTNAANV